MALLGSAGLIGLGLLLTSRPDRSGEAPPQVATPPPRSAAAAVPPAPPARPSRPVAARPAPDDLPEPIRRYLAATVYPPTSGRLTRAHQDLLEPNRRFERPRAIAKTVGGDPSQVVSALLTADHYHYVGDAVVHASLAGWRDGRPIPLRVLDAWVAREGRDGVEGDRERLHFVRSGGRLEADLPLGSFEDHHGSLVLGVRFEYAPGESHEELLRIFHTPRSRVPARIEDRFVDSVEEGSLRLDVGVDVEHDGFYRFDANLYDAEGEPLAFAVFKGELQRGQGSVPLEVYGKVLRDAGVAGPYRIGELRGYRFLDGQYPDREHLPPSPGTWTTAAYPLDAFTDEPHTDAHKQRMVELMLEDVEAGISLDVPGLPAPGETPSIRPPDDDTEVPVGPGPPAEAD